MGMLAMRAVISITLSLCLASLASVSVWAIGDNAKSDNYQIINPVFGSGSDLNCAGDLCAQQSVGDSAVGGFESANYSAQAGSNASSEPTLEILVAGQNNYLGVVKSDATATAVTSMTVRSYLSSGYEVLLVGSPPRIEGHTITSLTDPGLSQPGEEQFGVNVVKNTSPAIGQDPVQVPDGTFAFGDVKSGYDQANFFSYSDGQPIVYASSSSGQTDYTISMILNVSPSTPAGLYTTTLYAVVVPSY